MSIPDSPSLDLTSNFTVSADVRWDGTLGYQGIISKPREDDGSAGSGYALVVYDGRPCLATIVASGFSNRLACGSSQLTTGTWTNIQGAYTGSETLVWVNGILAADTVWPDFGPVIQGPTDQLIGREFVTDLTDRAFHGAIDNVRISTGVPPALTTVAYYPFEEGQGLSTVDASGHGHTGTLSATNTPVWIRLAPSKPLSVSAVAGDESATVSFSPPAESGASPVTSYTVTTLPGGAQTTGTGSPIVVHGLSNGRTYSFFVRASNSFGPGAPSSASNSITPNSSCGPAISSFSPASGRTKTIVTVNGLRLGGTRQVTFNGVRAPYDPRGDSRLLVFVPPGATTGPLRVNNSCSYTMSATSFVVTR